MEKFALLTLTAGQAARPDVVFGRSVLDHQIALLERSGVRRFLLTGDMSATDAARIVDRIKGRGDGASFHRSLLELDALLPAEARMIMLAGDAWLAPDTIDLLLQYDKAVLVTAAAGWERIDRDHHWAGVAVFGRRAVSASADLPEGWDVASTLLRQLAQDGARRIDAGGPGEPPAPRRVDTPDAARLIERQAVTTRASSHWIDRLLTRPLTGLLLKLVTARPPLRAAIGYIPLALTILAAIGGSLGAIAAAAAAALLALLTDRALRRIDPDFQHGAAPDWRWTGMLVLLVATVFVLARRPDITVIDCGLLVLSAGLCHAERFGPAWINAQFLLPVTALALLILSLTAGALALPITSLLCLTSLSAWRWARHRSGKHA